MLQALLHHKLGGAISKGYYSYSEDSLNSSIFGPMQYFPDEDLWNILRNACGGNELPESIGEIKEIAFWPHFDAEGTTNSNLVEPDMLIESSKYIVIVEAKKYDDKQMQYKKQWENEIKAIQNEISDKAILFIAIGGNESLSAKPFVIKDKTIIINKASWSSLLMAVQKYTPKDNNTKRIKADIIESFAFHGKIPLEWMDSINDVEIDDNSRPVIINSFCWLDKKKKIEENE